MAYFEDGHSAAWRLSGDRHLEDVLRAAQLVRILLCFQVLIFFLLFLSLSVFLSLSLSLSLSPSTLRIPPRDQWALCVVFSRLLEVDGLDENWEKGVLSEWEGDLGRHGAKDTASRVPAILHRMGNAACNIPRGDAFDLSGQGPRPDYTGAYMDPRVPEDAGGGTGEVRQVRNMSMRAFRAKLIEHFDIQWRRNAVRWPSRTGVLQMTDL